MNAVTFSRKISEYRKSKGLSQQKLGELLGVSAQAVSKWERGLCFPDLALLPDLARIFECGVNDLFELK